MLKIEYDGMLVPRRSIAASKIDRKVERKCSRSLGEKGGI